MMRVLRHKATVRFDVIAPAGFRILAALDLAAQECDMELIITCGTDSHTLPDPHCSGEAYEVSVQMLSAQQIAYLKSHLEDTLGPLFTVLYETPKVPSDPTLRSIAFVNIAATGAHMHVQRKKGATFPPVFAPP